MNRGIPPVEQGGAAFILGKIHVGLAMALECNDRDLRNRITALLDIITKDVNALYYSDPLYVQTQGRVTRTPDTPL
jgi:hypothetical protein